MSELKKPEKIRIKCKDKCSRYREKKNGEMGYCSSCPTLVREKVIEEYDKYHKQEIKSQKAIAFREGWEMLEQKLSVENIESAIEDAFWEAEENGKSLDYRGTAEAIHKLTKE